MLGGKLEQGQSLAIAATVHHLHGTVQTLARQLVGHVLVGGVALVEAAQQTRCSLGVAHTAVYDVCLVEQVFGVALALALGGDIGEGVVVVAAGDGGVEQIVERLLALGALIDLAIEDIGVALGSSAGGVGLELSVEAAELSAVVVLHAAFHKRHRLAIAIVFGQDAGLLGDEAVAAGQIAHAAVGHVDGFAAATLLQEQVAERQIVLFLLGVVADQLA